ncbi:hypothetical protein BH20CHL5_BH20CHL5_08150 [soil metagenome]|jgi:hypothetical protein
MHQQIRVKLAKPTAVDTPGAMRAGGVRSDASELPTDALVTMLEALAEKGYNLRSAGGHAIEGSGEFVFALDDARHDDSEACAQFLRDQGYSDVVVVELELCWMKDEQGELARCLRDTARPGRLIQEIHIGTPANDQVPVAFTTIQIPEEDTEGKGQPTQSRRGRP